MNASRYGIRKRESGKAASTWNSLIRERFSLLALSFHSPACPVVTIMDFRGSIFVPCSYDGGRTWTQDERNWWEPEKRAARATVVDRKTGGIFVFNQGTWPLQNDQGRPLSESWIIANYEKARQMGARIVMERSVDDGRTWTKVDVTEQFYTYPGAGLAWFIGTGIQLQSGSHAGRLVVPARYFAGQLEEVDPNEHNILCFHEALGPVYDDGYGQVAQVLRPGGP